MLFSSLASAQLLLGEHAIHDAARRESGIAIQRLLSADPALRDLKTIHGSQPIHFAAMNPDITALQALIAAGALINARDNEGATALHLAAYASRATHARLLLEAGADPMAKTDNGRDPTAMARKVKADEAAGVISLWILKDCKVNKPC
ncbi:MAG: ankyrin repeat domain-containing protein [Azonexus sp.]|nr:ankyrin repeat domain-containing protein [Azonexus sp.]